MLWEKELNLFQQLFGGLEAAGEFGKASLEVHLTSLRRLTHFECEEEK